MSKAKDSQPKYIPNSLKFLFGGLAGMSATCIVQPLDLLKTRMQLAGKGASTFDVASKIVKNEGFLALYNGLSAGLLRQATYTTARLGVFTYLFDTYKQKYGGANPGFGLKLLIGVTAGAVGAMVGTPAELSLIRMMADGRLPPEQRRNYANVFDALIKIAKKDGVLNLWKGATPTVVRAMVVNAAQLGTYSQAREVFEPYIPEGIGLHFASSMLSGLFTTIASMPVDIIKTRIQNSEGGQSQIGIVTELIKSEGIFALWKGFLPYYVRLGPHTVLTLMFLEQFNSAYFRYKGIT